MISKENKIKDESGGMILLADDTALKMFDEAIETIPCQQCGCFGNESCGHKKLGESCSLDRNLFICECCHIKNGDIGGDGNWRKNEK